VTGFACFIFFLKVFLAVICFAYIFGYGSKCAHGGLEKCNDCIEGHQIPKVKIWETRLQNGA
jgi:hypothetical protein